jgi:hypothetical protein
MGDTYEFKFNIVTTRAACDFEALTEIGHQPTAQPPALEEESALGIPFFSRNDSIFFGIDSRSPLTPGSVTT